MIKLQSNIPAELLVRLKLQLGIRSFVETGTCVGASAEVAALCFEHVWTIELVDRDQRQAHANLDKYPNVTMLRGNSPEILPQVIAEAPQPILFWLDAHWSGVGPQPAIECPLLEELRIIGGLRGMDVVLIDDARMFISSPDPPHDPGKWPNIAEVFRALEHWAQPRWYGVLEGRDVIAVTPQGVDLP